MDILIKEISIVCIYKNSLEIDSLDRAEIKSLLQEDYDEPPKYLEIPGPVALAVFDYLNNPSFPVQLSFQGKKQTFVINGTADIDLKDEEILTGFVSRQKELNSLEFLKELKKVALGFNFSITLQAGESEKIFENIGGEELDRVFGEEGTLIAKGFRIVRIKREEKKRIDFKAEPIIPEMRRAFTYSYNLHINIHNQPIDDSFLDSIQTNFLSAKNKALEMIESIAGV